jgi:heptaprenyl diphosphate synthase
VGLTEHPSLAPLRETMSIVEDQLRQAAAADDPLLREIATHLMAAGGKRVRPLLTVGAAAASTGFVSDDAVKAAVSVELIHLATLYHDDIIDSAERRRGVASVNVTWGNRLAALAGNVLFARATTTAVMLEVDVVGLLADTVAQVCEGELEQMEHAYDVDRTASACISAISKKTASLMSASARVGALVAGAPAAAVEALTAFGLAFGTAFQICDDIKDLTSTHHQLGKPAAHDIVEGTYGLPVIYALEDPAAGGPLRRLLGGPLDAGRREEARRLVLTSGALARARAEAGKWIDEAVAALAPLHQVPGDPAAVAALAALCTDLLADIP